MFITKKKLPRRTFLKVAGATLGLPLLDSMVPALAANSASAATPPMRFSVVYVPNGIQMERWTPATEGSSFELTPILRPLAPFRNQLLVVSGLADAPAFPETGEGTGDHVRAAATFLTGVHIKKTEGPDIRAGVSIDQIAARTIGTDTPVTSLELCLESNELVGACEAGYSCAYSNTLSWRDTTTPLPMDNQPRSVFERLFGDADDTTQKARVARIREDKSVLDALIGEVNRLQKRLGSGDNTKLNQYLDAIRDVERRIQRAERQSAGDLPPMNRPIGGIPSTLAEHARTMFDLQVLAFQCDLTRVATLMISRELSPRTYNEIGISDPHHPLSHHQNDPAAMEKLAQINTYHVEQFAYFLDRLESTPDGDGTLLDHALLLYGCGISNSNLHTHDNLPILLAGGADRRLSGGRHVRVSKNTPLTNLQLSVLNTLGVNLDRFGDSTGRISLVSEV